MLSWEQVQIRCWDYPTDTLVSLVSLDQCPAAVSMFQDSSPMLSTVSTPPTLPSHGSPPTLLLRYRLWSKTLLLRTLWKELLLLDWCPVGISQHTLDTLGTMLSVVTMVDITLDLWATMVDSMLSEVSPLHMEATLIMAR